MTVAVCTLQGTIVNANGKPQAATGVRARPVSTSNAPVFLTTGELLGQESVETITDDDGYFAMNLLRGLECVITIDVLGFAKKVVIPDQPTCNLKDL